MQQQDIPLTQCHHQSAQPFPVYVFDRSVLLTCLGGDEVGTAELYRVFLDDFPGDLQALQTSLDAKNAAEAECTAHSIKGAAANVGGQALRDAAFAIEKAAQAGNFDLARQHLVDLKAQFAYLKEAMEAWL